MRGFWDFLGETFRTLRFIRGVIGTVAGVLLLVCGVIKWDLRLFALGAFCVPVGAFYVWRYRPTRTAAPPPAPVVRTPRPAPRIALPRPVPQPLEALVPRVEQRPPIEYATDDGGPRFLR